METYLYKLINKLKIAYHSNQPTEDLIEVWGFALDDFTVEDLKRGYLTCIKHHKEYFPTPAQFREYAGVVDKNMVVVEAWNQFNRIIASSEDWQGKYSNKDPVLGATIDELGGTFHFKRMSQNQVDMQKKRFTETYKRLNINRKVLKANQEQYCLQIANQAPIQIGYERDSKPRELTKDEQDLLNEKRDKTMAAIKNLIKSHPNQKELERSIKARKAGKNLVQSDMRSRMLKEMGAK